MRTEVCELCGSDCKEWCECDIFVGEYDEVEK